MEGQARLRLRVVCRESDIQKSRATTLSDRWDLQERTGLFLLLLLLLLLPLLERQGAWGAGFQSRSSHFSDGAVGQIGVPRTRALRLPRHISERAIAVLDPDEFFLQPLTQRAEHPADGPFEILHGYPERLRHQVTDVVQPGWGVAQKYGIGAAFLHKFDQRAICPGGAASPCANMTSELGELYYPAGPPYILHNADFKKVMPTWWELMKPVYQQDRGDIQADMYAYVYAAVHHNVKHVMLENYMVSNVDMGVEGGGEAWKFVDALESMSCHNPEKALEGRKRPGFVHAAGHYKACTKGDQIGYDAGGCPEDGSDLWNFHKGHVPSTILSCNEPLLMPPPDDFFNVQAAAHNLRSKRTAFMICHLTFMVNRAALDYKNKFCESGFNAKECTRLIVHARSPGSSLSNPFGYPLARVDQECNK
ncbi:unnamed protein product [Prorocentrum cordatum]|uniref:Uncharacterized protein n=1 Tax=Prorocentrum cordatum TaxID=2364126 RepID=A0ABN9YDD6_9DINO|nr:unnamed protein product [Polarella glacialis]